jgi:TRAP-type mannitol/chloroaromatic compound transport system permease small subunit
MECINNMTLNALMTIFFLLGGCISIVVFGLVLTIKEYMAVKKSRKNLDELFYYAKLDKGVK